MSSYSKQEFDDLHNRTEKALADIEWWLSPILSPIKEQREEWHEQEEEQQDEILPSG